MTADRIDPSGIPTFTGNLEELERDAKQLRGDAGDIRHTGADTHKEFQGLSAFYTAPEAEQLFQTTKPVKDRADDFAGDLEKVAGALGSYAAEVRPIVAKLNRLKGQAHAFVDSIDGDDDWQYDEDKVNHNNDLVQDVSVATAQFWAAERAAANKITALVGGTHWEANDGSNAKNMYGYSVEDMKKAGNTPWGKAVEEKHHWYEVGHWVKSFVWDGLLVDGVWGTLKGLGGLVGFQGWDTFKQSWKGLGQLATGLSMLSVGGMTTYAMMPDGAVKDWMTQSLNTTKEVGKSLVAWDEWGKNPGRAAGLVVFNVVTTIGTGGAGAVAKTGTAGKVVAAAGRVGAVVDPMTYIGKGVAAGVGKLPKIGDVTGKLKELTTVKGVQFPDGGIRLPDGQLVDIGKSVPDLPAGKSGVELPDGAVHLPDGTHLAPDGTLHHPTGDLAQPGHQAPAEASAGDRAILDGHGQAPGHAGTPEHAHVPQHEPASVGAHHGPADAAIHGGDHGPGGPGGGGHEGPEGPGNGGHDEPGDEPRAGDEHPSGDHGPGGDGSGGSHIPPDEWDSLTPEEQVGAAEGELKHGAVTFPDNAAAMRYGAEHWNHYVENMPEPQREAVHDYTCEPPHTGPTYKDMNGFLRGNDALGTPKVRQEIGEIDKAMAGRPVPEDVTVVRGTGIGHYHMDPSDMEGETFSDPSYMSTSLGDPVASFAGNEAVLHLKVPKGTPALWVEKASAFGAGERELLLGRDLSYTVNRAVWHDNQWQIYAEISPK